MNEQLDLFASSCQVTEQDLQKKFDDETKQDLLTPRQWALFRLIQHNSLIENRKTTQREIYEKLREYGYEWNDDEKAHDHCVAVWSDIKDLNLSYQNDKVIISKNFEYWIGNEKETQEFLDKLWSDLCPRLIRYWNYSQKVSRDGQGQLFSTRLDPIDDNSKARKFIESYGKERISED